MSAISSDLRDGCHFLTYCREIAPHIPRSPETHDTTQVNSSWFSGNIYTPFQIVKSFPQKLPPLPLHLFRIFNGNFVQFMVYTCLTLNLSNELIMVLISAVFKLTAQDNLFSPNFYIIIKIPLSFSIKRPPALSSFCRDKTDMLPLASMTARLCFQKLFLKLDCITFHFSPYFVRC